MLRSLFAGISGLRVNQTRLDVIGNNIANANTTSTPQGGPYQRQVVRLRR